ncbi:hypothetical protein GJ744_010148 [Endocarpon pusillum]|uniref:Uncharacterized protein n=1 Tax=Endocarpon pusillum TaxID=364733 RepID=A0A8H7AGL0_9EURO|nr:hypothetical protein GJ744_010148 [Endocarpon pusillum]
MQPTGLDTSTCIELTHESRRSRPGSWRVKLDAPDIILISAERPFKLAKTVISELKKT